MRTAVRVKISAARVPRLRFTLGRVMIWVVMAAIASFIALEVMEPFAARSDAVDLLVGLVVSGAFGVGAMRHPWYFLAILVVLACAATTQRPNVNAATLSVGGSFIAWLVGRRLGTLHDGWKGVGSSQSDLTRFRGGVHEMENRDGSALCRWQPGHRRVDV